ncbi:MAG TPA: SRPBCC family protein [Nocardioidaceae bacterium]
MRHDGSSARRPILALAAAVPVVYAGLVRPRMLTWGATPEEIAATYPGDELVPDAEGSSTMATTLPAPPEVVWPWLVQMGTDRAGWYSWDRLDHGGRPSADRIVPEWQGIEEGSRLIQAPDGSSWFTVAVLEPSQALVLVANYELPTARSFDASSGPMPQAYMEGSWGFHLRPTADGGTRVVVRTRGKVRPRWLRRPFDVFGEPAHFIMQTRQFHNLHDRVSRPPVC